eukprot:gene15170-21242_t
MSSAISQFFILSTRGDVIVRRDFLGNVPRASAEIFFRHCKFWKGGPGGLGEGEAPPVFAIDGVTYLHMKEGGVSLVATARDNVSASLVLEFLRRISVIIKDYCGVLSEDAVRKNFALIYELLDEVVDYGVPQSTSTEALKTFVLNEPVVVNPGSRPLFSLNKGPTGVFKSVLDTSRTDGNKKDEIFVDVVERMTATFNASGHVASSQVDGAIQVKSYLTGNPPIKIRLNDELIIGRRDNPEIKREAGNSVFLDDASFHECANLDAFDTERIITLVPPDGEFALMNYRTTHGFTPPFRVYMTVEPDPISIDKASITLKIWCEVQPNKAASALEVEIPTPKYVQRVHCDLDDRLPKPGGGTPMTQSWDYSEKGHLLKWKFKKIGGGQDFTLRARLTLDRPYVPSLRSEIGPINLRFTIPMHTPSRLALKYLHILKKEKDYNPCRWVRYVTTSNSYTFRT